MLCLSAALCLPFCPPNLFWLFCLLSDCVSESKSRNPCSSYLAFRLWCIYLYPHKFASSYEQVGSKCQWACIHHRHLLYRCTHANIFIIRQRMSYCPTISPSNCMNILTIWLPHHPSHPTTPTVPLHVPPHRPTIPPSDCTILPSHPPTNQPTHWVGDWTGCHVVLEEWRDHGW